jgi:hypothetical protein
MRHIATTALLHLHRSVILTLRMRWLRVGHTAFLRSS